MLKCPNCAASLTGASSRFGIHYACAACGGRAIALPVLRRALSKEFIYAFWRQALRSGVVGARPCPFCSRPMIEVDTRSPALEVDVCRVCQSVWLDRGEVAEATPPAAERPESERDESAGGVPAMLANAAAGQRATRPRPPEDKSPWWQTLPESFVEGDDAGARQPQATRALVAAIAVVSVFVLRLGPLAEWLCLVPADPARLLGLPWITSFFVHVDLLHLLCNLCFLWLFGADVEYALDRRRFVSLVALAGLAGNALHVIGHPHDATPCLGAGAGISGVIAFHVLAFPHARLRVKLPLPGRPLAFRLSASLGVVVWGLLQVLGVFTGSDATAVAWPAHTGGVAVGLGFWLWSRPRVRLPDPTAEL